MSQTAEREQRGLLGLIELADTLPEGTKAKFRAYQETLDEGADRNPLFELLGSTFLINENARRIDPAC